MISRSTVLLLLPCILFSIIYGVQRDFQSAESAARNFISQRSPEQIPYELEPASMWWESGVTTHYLIPMKPEGFILMPTDDRYPPVLAYSFESDFIRSTLPDYLQERIQAQKQRFAQEIHDDPDVTNEYCQVWDAMLTGFNGELRNDREVLPLLTSTWAQDEGWNGDCPLDVDGPGGHVLTGCIAVCMSQLMYYWGYPASGTGSHSYVHPVYGTQTADFGNTIYQFANMDDGQATDAARLLLYHTAVSVEMDFGPAASGAAFYSPWGISAFSALQDHFGFDSDMELAVRTNFEDSEWHDLIRAELDESRPLMVDARDGALDVGHSWIIDGYQDDGYYHCNWGWGGLYNGYYLLDELNPADIDLDQMQRVILGIQPDGDLPGCTDENAMNYNPYATEDDGSCEYPDPPTELTATLMDEYIQLTWTSNYIPGNWPACEDGSGEFQDCVGTCFNNADCSGNGYDGCVDGEITWLGDGFCDDGTYGLDFNCVEYQVDLGDCPGGTGNCESIDPFTATPMGCQSNNTHGIQFTWGGGCEADGIYYGMGNVYDSYFDLSPYGLTSSFSFSGFGPDQTWQFQLVSGDLSSRVISATTGEEDCGEGRLDMRQMDIQIILEFLSQARASGTSRQKRTSQRSELTGFHLYRSQTSGSGYSLIASLPADSPSYQDTDIQGGNSYYYVATVVLDNSYESPFSEEAAVELDNSPGDANGDGSLDVLDIVLIISFILGNDTPDDYQAWAADLNGDGNIDVLDIVSLVSLIIG